MKEFSIVGPLYHGDIYVIINGDVIQLSSHADGNYHFKTGEYIIGNMFRNIVKAAASESADDLMNVIPDIIDMPNWIDLVNKMKQSITGKVITGTWVSFNKFLVDNEEIDVLPSSGVGDLLDKFNTPFPRNCTVILVDKIFINGETQKVIPWTFSF